MAIKINNKDLARRVINWQDVQRVILDWSQIRPTEQKYINYHIISKWWWWWGPWEWVPWGWSTWGSTVIEETGVSNGGTWQTANLNYNWLPSLLNAYKVEIVYYYHSEQNHVGNTLLSYLEYAGSQTYNTNVYGDGSSWAYRLSATAPQQYPLLASLQELSSDYTLTITLDLENSKATIKVEIPSKTYETFITLDYTDIYNIRHSDEFWVLLNDGIRLSRVDFFVYNNPELQPMWAWIYHNATLWLLSYSLDWDNWVTIADKDLWASSIRTEGKLYQWGNNYWFAPDGLPTTSHTKVDVSDYWPWNYYYSDTFIVGDNADDNWYLSNNANLWWWITNTDEAKRWPCPSWFHIPTETEFNNLTNIVTTMVWSTQANDCRPYLLMDYDGMLLYNFEWGVVISAVYVVFLWTSSMNKCVEMDLAAPRVYDWGTVQGLPIRPFANTPVVPNSTRTVLYQPS